MHVGYFDLEGIFPLEKVLFLAERLGSKESNMYLASYNYKSNRRAPFIYSNMTVRRIMNLWAFISANIVERSHAQTLFTIIKQ